MQKISVKEARAQGYEFYIFTNEVGTEAYELCDLTEDMIREDGANIRVLGKEATFPSIDEETVSETLAAKAMDVYREQTGYAEGGIEDAVLEVDFSQIAKAINEKLGELDICYYKALDIGISSID